MILPKCVTADHRGSDAGQEAEEARPFSQSLLRIGDSRESTYDDIGEGQDWVPHDMLDPMGQPDTGRNHWRDPWDLAHRHQDKQYMSERIILTLKNWDVDSINEMIMQSALLFCECTIATSDHSIPLHALQSAAVQHLVRHLLQQH